MKHVAITFDDGRSDNYLLAKQIMDKHQLRGTVYITTGFIDGTWEEKEVLKSPTRPLTITEIVDLYDSGWEIGLHGDKHQTQVDDMRVALDKLQLWGIEYKKWGISIPNSATSETEIESIFASEYGEKISYVRRGRRCDTALLKNKVLYGLYSVLKSKWAYRRFNAENVFFCDDIDKSSIPSVVVKANDISTLIIDFIERLTDEATVVLMLHSILPASHPMCGKDPWSWDEKNFEMLCSGLESMMKNNKVEVVPLIELMKGRVG